MTITQQDLDNWFVHHPPQNDGDVAAYQAIRDAGKVFASVILENTLACPDQTVAIRTVREAVMWANAARATFTSVQ